jgi:hydroxymethylpyrimidine pyrophosphatase-like HAD family hydrolase
MEKIVPLAAVSSLAAARAFAPVTHIYSDLDGTMLAPGGRVLTTNDGQPSTAVANALVQLKLAGVEIILVTGRNRSQGTEIMRLLNLEHFIGELGCVVQTGYGPTATVQYDLGSWTSAQFDPEGGITPYQLIAQSGIIDQLSGQFAGRLEPHNPYGDTREVTQMMRGCVDADEITSMLASFELPLQLYDNGIIHPRVHTLCDCQEIHIYHLMPPGAGKGAAVANDMARRGLSRQQTTSIGDAIGDVEMGTHTGSFVLAHNSNKSHLEVQAVQNNPGISAGFATQGATADGWVEFATALLAAN